ncbi:hypothetical protein V6Z12_A07G139200 [Gossypium hirsutum]
MVGLYKRDLQNFLSNFLLEAVSIPEIQLSSHIEILSPLPTLQPSPFWRSPLLSKYSSRFDGQKHRRQTPLAEIKATKKLLV